MPLLPIAPVVLPFMPVVPLVPVRPVAPTVPARLSTTPAEPVVPVIGLVLLRRSFCGFMLLVPVALIDERPVASCMLLPVWLPTWPEVPAMPVPVVPVAVPVRPACKWRIDVHAHAA